MDDMAVVESELKKIDDQQKAPHSQVIEVCPICGESLEYYRTTALGIIPIPSTEQKYFCKNCGYIGSICLEVSSAEDIQKIKEHHIELKNSETINHKADEVGATGIMTSNYSWLWKDILVITGLMVVSTGLISFSSGFDISPEKVIRSATVLGLTIGATLFYINKIR